MSEHSQPPLRDALNEPGLRRALHQARIRHVLNQPRLRRALSTVKWYVGSIMGDNHYERYVQLQRARHPGEPVMSKREYWRARTDAQDQNPQSRCC